MKVESFSKHLDALASKDPKASAKALAALRKTAIVEGDVTREAVPLAPRLVEIARDPKAPELAGILALLADLLVCGEADLWIKIGYEVRTPAFEEADPDQYGRALYESIASGTKAYLAHLDHDDAAVRAHVAPLLAYLSRQTGDIEPSLLAHVGRERDPAAQASLAIALAHQATYAKDERALEALLSLSRSDDPVARLGASAALAIHLGARAPDDAVATLVEGAKKQRKKVKEVPWFGGELANLAVVVTAWLASQKGDLALAERLVAAAEKLPTHFWAVGSLLDAAFAGDDRPTPRAPGELAPGQARAVLQVAADEDIERLASGLRRHGLPADAKALACVAGKGPQTALAKKRGDEPLLRLAARALRTTSAEEEWHLALSGLSDDERIVVARDAHCHPLRIWSLPRPSVLDPERDDFVIDDRDDRALLTRAVEILARDLAQCSTKALASALEAIAKEKLQPPGYLAALVFATCEAAARLGEEVPEAVDARFAKINPGSTFGAIEGVRSALGRLPRQRREAIVLARHYWHKSAGGGDVQCGGAWLIADLAPTAAVAEATVKEIASWSGGSAPYPEDHAVDLLRRIGGAARPAIEAALAKPPKYANVLRRALGKAS